MGVTVIHAYSTMVSRVAEIHHNSTPATPGALLQGRLSFDDLQSGNRRVRLGFGVIWTLYIGLRSRAEAGSRATKAAAAEAGLLEPASLHPKIDPSKCVGCGACARVCPEGDILGMINGKAELIEPSHCIGHGACKEVCPRDAITLVFGTEKRGVDIPDVGPDFQTNVPGIFIAGELGGMGLIRNAIEQGRQAIDSVRKLGRRRSSNAYDVIIVGALRTMDLSSFFSATQPKPRPCITFSAERFARKLFKTAMANSRTGHLEITHVTTGSKIRAAKPRTISGATCS
jgi:ferredoxin